MSNWIERVSFNGTHFYGGIRKSELPKFKDEYRQNALRISRQGTSPTSMATMLSWNTTPKFGQQANSHIIMLQEEVARMTKDRLVEALEKIQNGEDAGFFHDELETLLGVVMDFVTDEQVAKAFSEIHIDDTTEK
jgi:hypothetical protein